MGIINFLKKIVTKITAQVIKDIRRKESEAARMVFDSIKTKGNNSKFLGSNLYISDVNKIKIGTNVTIKENAYIKSDGGLIIGDNTHIDRNIVINTFNHDYNGDVIPYNNELIEKQVVIGHNVWIGMNVCIAPGTIIGDGCIIGMGTVVSGEVPPLSIIGSEKWKVINKRDEDKYVELIQRKRFGKENGLLYRSGNKILKEVGDFYTNQRTYLELIDYNGTIAIKKSWENNKEALDAFENEKDKYVLFEKYYWLPKLYEIGENYLIIEFLENKFRLDQVNMSQKTRIDKNKILGDIIVCLLDMFGHNIAHCDIHSKNIFLTPKGIKIIDFETAQALDEDVGFFDSYDITAIGLPSPFNTNRSCVLGQGKYSLKEVFQIEDGRDLKLRFQKYLIEELFKISNTFFTRKNELDGRHTLKNRYIYSTFNLEFLKVNNTIGQRDISRRLERFNIEGHNIKGKNILDIGSNIGSILFEVAKMQPESALGLEYDESKVRIANIIKNLHFRNNNLVFEVCDVENSSFLEGFKKRYEVVFCLAVVEHLKNKDVFIKKLGEVCTEVLYFEGNSGTDVSYIKEKLTEAGFFSVEFIGMSDDEKNESNNNRPLFRAKK